MPISNLWLIMPVYNEEDAIKKVVLEWLDAMSKHGFKYTFCLLDDGSQDNSFAILTNLKEANSQLLIIKKENTGHGQTCLSGYRLAIEHGADWILQLDSDGQCIPSYFNSFIEQAQYHPIIFGQRIIRDDGWFRKLISIFVSIFTWTATGIWLKDANVPYRLMKATHVQKVIDKIPSSFHLANVFLSVLLRQNNEIYWIPMRFRNRLGGQASVKSFSFLKHGITLFKQLRQTATA